jgi:hypothetical protein
MSTKTRLETLEREGAKVRTKRDERERQEVRAYLATLSDAELDALEARLKAEERAKAPHPRPIEGGADGTLMEV